MGGVEVDPQGVAGAFAKHFHEKIKANVTRTKVKASGVYNGKCKIIVQNRNFMLENDVRVCLSELKNKKCEGFDRIPLCMLPDARVKLLPPRPASSVKFLRSCKIPEQWKVAKIIPIFKKAAKLYFHYSRQICLLRSFTFQPVEDLIKTHRT